MNQHIIDYRKNLMKDAARRLKRDNANGYGNMGNDCLLEQRAIKWHLEVINQQAA
jgi:hypothetical protein